MLHIVSTASESVLNYCLSACTAEDSVLFIDEGIYSIFLLESAKITTPLFVLEMDLKARGLVDKIKAKISIIDFDKFAELTEQYEKIISW